VKKSKRAHGFVSTLDGNHGFFAQTNQMFSIFLVLKISITFKAKTFEFVKVSWISFKVPSIFCPDKVVRSNSNHDLTYCDVPHCNTLKM